MELIVMIGLVVLLGGVILSTIAQRSGPPQAAVFVVRAEQLERLPAGDGGSSLFVLLAVIALALWLL